MVIREIGELGVGGGAEQSRTEWNKNNKNKDKGKMWYHHMSLATATYFSGLNTVYYLHYLHCVSLLPAYLEQKLMKSFPTPILLKSGILPLAPLGLFHNCIVFAIELISYIFDSSFHFWQPMSSLSCWAPQVWGGLQPVAPTLSQTNFGCLTVFHSTFTIAPIAPAKIIFHSFSHYNIFQSCNGAPTASFWWELAIFC